LSVGWGGEEVAWSESSPLSREMASSNSSAHDLFGYEREADGKTSFPERRNAPNAPCNGDRLIGNLVKKNKGG